MADFPRVDVFAWVFPGESGVQDQSVVQALYLQMNCEFWGDHEKLAGKTDRD